MRILSATAARELLNNKELYNEHKSATLSINKEMGVKNLKAVASVFSAPKCDQLAAFAAVKGGKKCTPKQFLAACKVYAKMMAYRANIRQAKYINRLELIKNIIDRNVVPSVSGKTKIDIRFVSNPEEVTYVSETKKGDCYSCACSYRKTDIKVAVSLPQNWYARVYLRGMSKIDGLFNLDISTPLRGKYGDGVEVFAATWLVNGLGTSKNVVRGFIARCGKVSYHGKTLASAVRGLARKIEIQGLISGAPSEIIERAKKADVFVTLADSYAVGNCEWGTKDFCFRHGINISDENASIHIKDLAKKVELEPRQEAMAVLIRALKKSLPAKKAM